MFDGNKDNFKEWQRKLFIYVRDLKNKIVSDDERINISLSYMEGTLVRDWVQNLYNTRYNEERDYWDLTWKEFKQELNNKFLDHAREQKARQQFEVMRQHQNESVSDFFIRLELLLHIAGYKREDGYVVDKLE